MRKFEMSDITPEILEATAECEDWQSVQKLFADRDFDLSDNTAQMFFDYTRERELEEDELNAAGGTCSGDSDSSTNCTTVS